MRFFGATAEGFDDVDDNVDDGASVGGGGGSISFSLVDARFVSVSKMSLRSAPSSSASVLLLLSILLFVIDVVAVVWLLSSSSLSLLLLLAFDVSLVLIFFDFGLSAAAAFFRFFDSANDTLHRLQTRMLAKYATTNLLAPFHRLSLSSTSSFLILYEKKNKS